MHYVGQHGTRNYIHTALKRKSDVLVCRYVSCSWLSCSCLAFIGSFKLCMRFVSMDATRMCRICYVCQSWCLSELYLKRLLSLSFYRSCQFIPQLAICHSLLGIYFMRFLHGAQSCYNNYHKTLLQNIVTEHCYNYKALLQLQSIVTITKHCDNYKTLWQLLHYYKTLLQNIVTII